MTVLAEQRVDYGSQAFEAAMPPKPSHDTAISGRPRRGAQHRLPAAALRARPANALGASDLGGEQLTRQAALRPVPTCPRWPVFGPVI
jgi:hypothetical protein